LSIRFEQGKKKRFNTMHTWYIDPTRDWQRVESLPRRNATYVAADRGEEIGAETDQAMCTNEYEAQRKGEFLLRQSRNQIVVTGRLPPRMQNIALWDTGTIVFANLGWASKTFRCVGIELNVDGSVDGTFAEEQSGDWTDLAASDYNGPSTVALPAINVTTPSELTSFTAVPQINGTILFGLGNPIVRPFNTIFRIIRSTSSRDASVGTTVWAGNANVVPLVMPTSRHWYYAQAYVAGSNPEIVSPYLPNTFGLSVLSIREANNSELNRVIPDAEFTYSTSEDHWKFFRLDAIGNSVSNNYGVTINIEASGGVENTGRLSIAPESGYEKVFLSARTPAFPVITGQSFAMRIRWMRNGTQTIGAADDATNPVFELIGVTHNANVGSIVFGTGMLTLRASEMNTYNNLEWQEKTAIYTAANAPKNVTQLGYVSFRGRTRAVWDGGGFYIDSIKAWEV
jgi:hypothetical protein